MDLREYQKDAINSIKACRKDTNKILISLATGLGKTVIFSQYSRELIKETGKKILVIAHREELLNQAGEKYIALGLKVAKDQGVSKLTKDSYQDSDIIVASVSTLGRKGTSRLWLYEPLDFCLVIIDEAHRSLATGYIRILEYFGISKHPGLDTPIRTFNYLQQGLVQKYKSLTDWNKQCLLLGVTATPIRTKAGESLKLVYDTLAYKYDLIDGIKDGWLCNIHNYSCKTTTDLSNVAIQSGDYNEQQLSETVNTPERNKLILDTYKKNAQKGATLIFSVDKQHNRDLAKLFIEDNINAQIIDSDTPKDIREQLLKDFKENKIPVIINVGVLTEGFDAPNIKNIMMTRPTKSLIFYIQAIGRGTRLSEGKEQVNVFDFVDNAKQNDPLTLKYILQIPEGNTTAQRDIKELLKEVNESGNEILSNLASNTSIQGQVIDQGLLTGIIKYIKENIIKESKFTWYMISENTWILPLPNFTSFNNGMKFRKCRFKVYKGWEEYQLSFEATTVEGEAIDSRIGVLFSVKEIDAQISGILIQEGMEQNFLLKSKKQWHQEEVSEKQRNYIFALLRKYGNKLSLTSEELTNINKSEAGFLINILNYFQ